MPKPVMLPQKALLSANNQAVIFFENKLKIIL
jgi:hypothetical protein